MEAVLALVIGVLAGAGVWLILRPRTFQVIMGLVLLSYGVNLFIFSMGSLFIGKEPIIKEGVTQDLLHYTDPLPQALVLTAIVISFAMTALFLVVLLASRGLTGTDHVDGREHEGLRHRIRVVLEVRGQPRLHEGRLVDEDAAHAEDEEVDRVGK